MHNAAIATLGLNAVYVPLRVPPMALPHVLRGFEAAELAGNVTVPHKVNAAGLIVRLTDDATDAGAVNTFWTRNGRLVGDNTDVAGVLDALEEVGGESPWLLAGTGGSARAVVTAARRTGADLLIRSRDGSRAEEFATWCAGFGVQARADDGTPVATAINATPLGLQTDDPLPIPVERLAGAGAAVDLVYAPGQTLWCRALAGAGLRVIDGRAALVGQGVHAFTRFFPDVEPPREVMRGVVEEALGR